MAGRGVEIPAESKISCYSGPITNDVEKHIWVLNMSGGMNGRRKVFEGVTVFYYSHTEIEVSTLCCPVDSASCV